jgi:YbbR domain-containing protein
MRISKSLRFFGENLLWLAGSLILAVFVWIASSTEQNPIESRRFPQRVPIDIVLDEGMIVTNSPISTARIALRAQSAVWEVLELDDINIWADATGKTPGTYSIELDIAFASNNRIVVEDLQPEQITVAIDQAAEALIPINPDIRTSPPTGFEINSISYDVQEIKVTGPASQVERVTSADVRLNLGSERNSFTRSYRVYAIDSQGRTVPDIELVPDTVSVSVDIQPGADFREVFVTPNIIGEPANGYVVFGITYEPQTILVSGRPSALEQLPGTVQTAPVDLTGRTGSFDRTVPVQLPEDVFLPTEQNVTVSVEIDTLTASRRFEHLPIQVQGLTGTELQAVITPNEVTLLITGPQPILDTLTPSDISIFADLSGLESGTHQVQLQAVINREGLDTANKSVLPPILDVQISSQATAVTPTTTLLPASTPIAIENATPAP